MNPLFRLSIVVLTFACSLAGASPGHISPPANWTKNMEVPHTRQYFYVGGHYEDLVQNGTDTGAISVNQIYVEKLVPVEVRQSFPLIIWTGNGQTGTNFLNTPDGRPGWASYFLSKGYVVYLTDQPRRGRSPWNPNDNDTFAIYTADYCSTYWTATQNSPNIWQQAALHTQFPGTGLRGDPAFDSFYASQVPALADRGETERLARPALTALLDKIGPAFLITHSQGGPHGFLAADSRPELLKGLVALEPEGPPFINELIRATGEVVRPYGVTITPVAYDPPVENATDLVTMIVPPQNTELSKCVLQASPPRRLSNISKVPIFIVTSEAGYHSVYDYCTVDYLKQASVSVDWLHLPTIGIHGNGHFMFMEKNNMDIAEQVEIWLQAKGA